MTKFKQSYVPSGETVERKRKAIQAVEIEIFSKSPKRRKAPVENWSFLKRLIGNSFLDV
jgi:hypothetical protein